MACLLGILLRAHSAAAMAVYLSLRNARAREDAVSAAAGEVLKDRDLKLFKVILKIYGAVEAERNSLAHGCYGIHDAIPDGVIWIQTKHLPKQSIEMLTSEVTGQAFSGTDSNYQLAGQMYVYRESDLEKISEQIIGINWILHRFNFEYLRPSGVFDREKVYREIIEHPLMRDDFSPQEPAQGENS